MKHIPWTEISLFHNLLISLKKYGQELGVNISNQFVYKAKVKIHGTNACVVIDSEGSVTAQSRESIITPEKDNAGFARWVSAKPEFKKFAIRNQTVAIFGEWAGPSVQKGMAVSKIPNKIFAVFGIVLLDSQGEVHNHFIFDPTDISDFIRKAGNIENVYVIPWYKDKDSSEDYSIKVKFDDESSILQNLVQDINEHVLAVEQRDPFIFDTFKVEGLGEGLVFYPITHARQDGSVPEGYYYLAGDKGYSTFTSLVFKAKGEKHQTVAHSKPAQVDPNIAASANEFAKMVLSPARLEQGVQTTAGSLIFEMKSVASFLKWIQTDVEKECSNELEASGLDKNLAMKACQTYARIWFIEQSKKV